MKEQPFQSIDSNQKPVEQAFLASYETHSDELFRFCLVKTRNRDAALDAVQETFTRTWEYLRRGRTIEAIRPFLFRTARNIIIDESRKHKSASLDEMKEISGYDAPAAPITPGTTVDLAQALEAIEALEPIHREILTLRFLHEFDIAEIAKTLDLSENAVSVRIHRGIEALKKSLGPGFQLE